MINWFAAVESNALSHGSGVPSANPGILWALYLNDDDGTIFIWNGAAWILFATAVFGGTIGTVTQGTPGPSPWLVREKGGWSAGNIVLAAPTTTTLKSGAGTLHSITVNKPVASAVLTIYDNTAASGTKIGTITLPGTLLSDGPRTAIYDVDFAIGLTLVSSGAAADWTVAYR